MEKVIKLFDYKDKQKEITIKDFENVKLFVFRILSGDGVLTVIYQDNETKYYDSCDSMRLTDYNDGLWIIEPKDIDILNRMENHYDTEELDIYTIGI